MFLNFFSEINFLSPLCSKVYLINKVNSRHSNFASCPCLNVNYVTAIVKMRKQSGSGLRTDVAYFPSLLLEVRIGRHLHAGSSGK